MGHTLSSSHVQSLDASRKVWCFGVTVKCLLLSYVAPSFSALSHASLRPRAVMFESALSLSFFYLICFQTLACVALPSPFTNTPPARRVQKRSSPDDPSLSSGVIAICAMGGLVFIAAAFTIYWLFRQRVDKVGPPSHQGFKHSSSGTSICTFGLFRSPPPIQGQGHTLSLSPHSEGALTPYDMAIESGAFELPRGKSRHERNDSRGKSVGGIYELPASPRRVLIPGEWSDECIHTWTGGEAPRDSKNKMLPEIPGEGRRWI